MQTCPATVDTKVCCKCKEEKPREDFYSEPRVRDGLTARCKKCMKSDATDSYVQRADEVSKRNRQNYCSDKEWAKKIRLNYGLSVDDYYSILEFQGNKCAICGTASSGSSQHDRFVVDHCHATGKVRGLLCVTCNTALGLFYDSKVNLLSAISYLALPPTDQMNHG